jgi:hypothetical protein
MTSIPIGPVRGLTHLLKPQRLEHSVAHQLILDRTILSSDYDIMVLWVCMAGWYGTIVWELHNHVLSRCPSTSPLTWTPGGCHSGERKHLEHVWPKAHKVGGLGDRGKSVTTPYVVS